MSSSHVLITFCNTHYRRKAASDVYDEVALEDHLHHEVMKRFYVQGMTLVGRD